jgi:hypothetical protein
LASVDEVDTVNAHGDEQTEVGWKPLPKPSPPPVKYGVNDAMFKCKAATAGADVTPYQLQLILIAALDVVFNTALLLYPFPKWFSVTVIPVGVAFTLLNSPNRNPLFGPLTNVFLNVKPVKEAGLPLYEGLSSRAFTAIAAGLFTSVAVPVDPQLVIDEF